MNKNMILLIGALVAAYFLLSGKKGTSAAGSKPGGTNGTGTAGKFNAPKGSTAAGNNGFQFSDIGNYANQFANLTKTVSGLYDNYFGGATNPGYNDPTALDSVDVTDFTDTPDAGYLGG